MSEQSILGDDGRDSLLDDSNQGEAVHVEYEVRAERGSVYHENAPVYKGKEFIDEDFEVPAKYNTCKMIVEVLVNLICFLPIPFIFGIWGIVLGILGLVKGAPKSVGCSALGMEIGVFGISALYIAFFLYTICDTCRPCFGHAISRRPRLYPLLLTFGEKGICDVVCRMNFIIVFVLLIIFSPVVFGFNLGCKLPGGDINTFLVWGYRPFVIASFVISIGAIGWFLLYSFIHLIRSFRLFLCLCVWCGCVTICFLIVWVIVTLGIYFGVNAIV